MSKKLLAAFFCQNLLIKFRKYHEQEQGVKSCIKESYRSHKGVPQDTVLGFSPETRRFQGGNLRFTVGFSVHAKLAQ